MDRICIYDSMHRGGDLTSSLQIQLAQVYKTKIEREGSHKTLNVECLWHYSNSMEVLIVESLQLLLLIMQF